MAVALGMVALARRGLARALAAAMLAVAPAGGVAADTLESILDRGTVRVGVKADYPPYGFLDENRRIVGLEPDLARDVAELLDVDLELVAVTSSTLEQTLAEGRVDLLIATLPDTPSRREAMRMVQPDYYAAGINILTRGNFVGWDDLQDLPLCSILGAYYDREPARRFGTDVVGFKTTAEALTALKQNRCAAFLYDEPFIRARLGEPEWEGWKMPLPTVDTVPWGLAVRKDDAALAALLGGLVVRWHLSGRLLDLQQRYAIAPTDFVKRMNELFRGINPAVGR